MHPRSKNGKNALHYAADNNETEVLQILIEFGCEKNLQDINGQTALHIAAQTNSLKVVTFLLNRDCDPNITNVEGKKPIDLTSYKSIKTLFEAFEKNLLPGLPTEVKKFDTKSAQVFASLLEEESYPHFEARVMLAGQQGTGKTTIARYLVGKCPTRIRISTDGIELYNGLSYMDRESKDWLGGHQDFSLEEITFSRSLLKGVKPINVDDTTLTSKDLPVMSQAMSLPASKEKLRRQSKENSMSVTTSEGSEWSKWPECSESDRLSSTKSFKTGLNSSEFQFETVPVNISSIDGNMSQQLVGQLCKQNAKSQCNDENYETVIQDSNRNSGNQSELLVSDGERSGDNRNRQVEQENPTRKDYTDFSIDNCLGENLPYTDISMDDLDRAKSGNAGEVHLKTVTKPGLIRKLKQMFGVSKKVKEVKVSITKENFLKKTSKVGKKQLHNKKIAPIIIWDFGGQDVFYSTHQTFLTYRAIYIIVLDGSRKLDDPCPYEQYLPGKSGHKSGRDYLLFWINTIVTYCKGSVKGFPKILVVLTHKDRVTVNEVEQRRHEIFAEITKMFHQTSFMQHLVLEDKIFVNAQDKYDPEMTNLKGAIISESERQPTWGEPLPKCFIPLELEFASLIRQGNPLITLEHLKKINALQPIRPLSETELKVFLKFQHSIGKLLYFDEHKLDDRIILSPTLLIDAFKSIVTDKRFCQGDKKREELWDVMDKKGVVSKPIIEQIWKKKKYKKFYKDKDYLLDVMTHLDILAEPKKYDLDRNRIPADFYYVASMVRAEDDSGYLQSAGFTTRSIAIAFQSSSLMIPPALSFRFISYCLYIWAVKTYGDTNKDMLFHRSGVFTIDSSLDMYIACEDERIVVRLVHATSNTLIMRDVASSIYECLTSALEKISQLYIRTSSDQTQTSDASFMTRICCNSPNNSCVLPDIDQAQTNQIWICPSHGIEHNIHTITSWIEEKEDEKCKPGCTVTKDEFLKVTPSDIHLRRLSLLYSPFEAKELAIHLGVSNRVVNAILETEDPLTSSFAILLRCRDSRMVTFKDIKEAIESIGKENMQPEKWDLVPTAEHIDRLAPLVGKYSLPFLIELGMDLNTWEQISHRQNKRDLVRLNQDILEEWRFKFCRMHNLKPTLRKIARAFSNIDKNIKLVENTLSDLF
ncbi:uncharacterized protein LOC134700074 [Mytilus trossulus]|uniref:uncharacterized protein LOC134700074 n=1 Tax=Mytilus trossulus TaxID=6551 RepID=UPI0030050F7C